MTGQEQNNIPEEIDLRQIFKVVNKWKGVIALITLASLFTSAILSYFVLQPVYESKAMLLVAMTTDKVGAVANNNGTDNLESMINNISRIPQLTMNTYVNQLKTEELLKRVAENLKLDPKVYSPGALSGIITATAIKDSNLIDIRVRHNDPVMASKIANAVTQEYLNLISEKNQSKMTRSVGFLDQQRQLVEKELDQVLLEIKTFESQPQGLAFLDQQFNTKNQDLAKYQSMLNEARVDLSRARAGMDRLAQELKGTPPTISVNKVVEGSGALISEESNPVYVQLSQDYVARTTQVSETDAKISAMGSIIGEIGQDVNRIQVELAQKKDQRERLESQKTRLVNARDLLAEKVTQTQIAKSIDLGDTSIAVVSPAMVPPGPVKPNKELNMAVALVLGLMLALFAAFIMEYLDNTVKSPREVEEKLNAPMLGAIPLSGRRKY